MPELTIRRTRTVTEEVDTTVEVSTRTTSKGGFEISLNGQKALLISSTGYLRRYPGLGPDTGVRLTPDGRIAMKRPAQA